MDSLRPRRARGGGDLGRPGKDRRASRVRRAQLANLAANARDAIGGVGKLTIGTEKVTFDEAYCRSNAGTAPGEYVQLSMSDDGCGMDRATQSHLFEPFFTTKAPEKGTGPGLATVFGVVKQNKGFISAYSEPGRRSTFRVYLPRASGASAATGQPVATAPVRRGNETVLVAEDEAAILALARESLAHLGYMVLVAGTRKRPSDSARRSRTLSIS